MSERDCHCLCVHWGHHDVCTGVATESLPFFSPMIGEPRDVPLCAACKGEIEGNNFRRAVSPAGVGTRGNDREPASDRIGAGRGQSERYNEAER